MRFITLDENNIVVSVRFGLELIGNEIETNSGELGQRLLSDGTYEDVEQEIYIPTPSINEQILFENKYQTMILEMGIF